jgi:DNA-directed RNA polymerase specialized sigma24 family protein
LAPNARYKRVKSWRWKNGGGPKSAKVKIKKQRYNWIEKLARAIAKKDDDLFQHLTEMALRNCVYDYDPETSNHTKSYMRLKLRGWAKDYREKQAHYDHHYPRADFGLDQSEDGPSDGGFDKVDPVRLHADSLIAEASTEGDETADIIEAVAMNVSAEVRTAMAAFLEGETMEEAAAAAGISSDTLARNLRRAGGNT